MQGLSGFRISHCFFPSSGRSPAAKRYRVLLGFQQTSSSLKCCRKALTLRVPKLKTSLQDGAATDGAATENALSPSGEEVSRTLVEEEVTNDDVAFEEGPKVKVKFVLEKKCYFGQRFNVVGNDPLFGNWEVGAAIPMQWEDGDIWTVELDVPAEEQFEFKFVLTGEDGKAVWQPGSNRIFNTAGGNSPMVVNEAWHCVDEAATVEGGEGGEDPINDTTKTSESGGTLVPMSENAAKDEVLQALESKVDDVHSTPSKSDFEEPEVPLAEVDIAATVVKTVAGVDDAA